MVVDDEKIVRDLFLRILPKQGFEVFAAKDGKEGLKLLQRDTIDLALVDIKMPGMSGITLLKKIKKLNPDLEVIIITGYASLDSAIKAVKHGAFDYIKKPLDELSEILRVIQRALEKRRLKLENVKLTQELKKECMSLRCFMRSAIRSAILWITGS